MTRDILRRRLEAAVRRRHAFAPKLDNSRASTRRRRSGQEIGNTIPSGGNTRGRVELSVGVDVVSVAEVSAAIDRFGDRYVRRTFTADEAAYCQSSSCRATAERFAVRFAAKEAALKALQPARPWTDWSAIEVQRYKSGRCGLVLRREAAALAGRRRIERLELSMSHDGDHAVAVVVALRTARVTHATR
jgi:holo-[acyl-carrier protein] synthase